MLRKCVPAAVLLFAVSAALGQTRYHFGDDPRWADPSFNDKNWPAFKEPVLLDRVFEPMWSRSHILAPADAGAETAVLWPANCGSVSSPAELFMNGVKVTTLGNPARGDVHNLPSTCVFLIPAGLIGPGQSVTAAVRTSYTQFAPVEVVAGRRDVLEERAQKLRAQRPVAWSLELARGILLVLLGIALLTAGKIVRASSPVFWFGAWLVAEGGFSAIDVVQLLSPEALTNRETALLYAPLNFFEIALILSFVWTLYELRLRWLLRGTQVLIAAVQIVNSTLAYRMISSGAWTVLFEVILIFPFLVLAGVAVWGLTRRGDGRLVAIGLLAVAFTFIAPILPGPSALPGWFSAGPFTFYTATVGLTIFAIGVSILLWRRAWSNWRGSERIRGEIAAAREIQCRLIPREPLQIPGFHLEAAFLPAEAVGGDFYQILPVKNGGALIVVGDVSGKGLKAAMVVSTIVGALRNEFSRRPAEVLCHLNRTLAGQIENGFVTCCAAVVNRDGTVEIANAGHIPPYLNGVEVTLDPTLPLGIAETAEYSGVVLPLRPGDRMAFMSDGVAEARDSGGELYGFYRTRALSGQTAGTIAETARAFGQEDDITVLTVDCQAEAAHAA